MKEKVLLKWQYKPRVSFKNIYIPKRNIKILVFLTFFLIAMIYYLSTPGNFIKALLGFGGAILIMVIVLFGFSLLFNIFLSRGIEYKITDEGIFQTIVVGKKGPGPIARFITRYTKFRASIWGNRVGNMIFMPFRAMSGYNIRKYQIWIFPKLPGACAIRINTDNNLDQITSIMEKKGIKRRS